jgi:hypothetical protein
VEVGGVVNGALSVATPVEICLSAVVKETGFDLFDVSFLAHHLSHEGFLNFTSHLHHGVSSFLGVFSEFREFVASNLFIEVKGAVGWLGTSSHESFGWWIRGEGSVLVGEAWGELIWVAVGSWLNPLGEIFSHFTDILDDSSLVYCNIIDHWFGGSV